MSDERTGRELEPRGPDREVGPARGPESSVERFYAGEAAHTVGLTEERAAGIVRQSGNARFIAFLATLIVVLFVPLYWFYDVGVPAVPNTSRLQEEARVQQVTNVSRGYELYLANCAQCHGENGEGGIGPALNDQAKLYNAVTPNGQPGTGHLNPNYIRRVLTVGGRYVCGDPESLMPVWADTNGGPLNYLQIEELIAWLVASKDITFTYEPEHAAEPAQTLAPTHDVSGWRDPAYEPPPDATPVPECWRDPDGPLIGGANDGGGSGGASSQPIDQPGTTDQPRVIEAVETADLKITDPQGERLTALDVVAGETVTFRVTNDAGFAHNFYVGEPEALEANRTGQLEGIPDFTEGTDEFIWTVPTDTSANLQFACTVPGHYGTMNGDLRIQAPAGG